MMGTVIDIYVNPYEDVIQLKRKIQDKEGIPTDQQRLIFAGRMLEDGDALIGTF